ncbi:MAG: GxxExxY protein [Pyrinomonadaceae bacterium]
MSAKGILYEEKLTGEIIGAAIDVHRQLGPGLLESTYQACLCRELELRSISFECQKPLPLEYKGVRLGCGYRIDLVVMGLVIVEIKSVDAFAPIHKAQLLTYLRLTGLKIGLLINFNVVVLKDGIKRLVF